MTFVSGLVLCRRFHDEVIGPLVRRNFPGLAYAAARLDSGSELLGLDTPRSTDHDWGPRLQIFVGPVDAHLVARIDAAVTAELPPTFLGYPTSFAGDASSNSGLGVLSATGDRHGVRIAELGTWFAASLGFDPRAGITTADWLATPTQRLAEITGGAIFHDGLENDSLSTGGAGDGNPRHGGTEDGKSEDRKSEGGGAEEGKPRNAGAVGGALTRARAQLAWYPDDLWRYVLAAQWTRIAQEEHFVGRCGEVGDELGSRVIAARLVRDLMRLCLLLSRRYPPYGKWLGSEFARLPGSAVVAEALAGALDAGAWPERETYLCRVLESVAVWTNEVGLASSVEPTVRRFHNRPFLVLDAGRFATALRGAIADPWLRDRPLVGAVDQFVDSTDVLSHAARFRAAALAVCQSEEVADGHGPRGSRAGGYQRS